MALNIQEQRPAGVDLRERGRDKSGNTLYLDARLFMQLQVFTGSDNAQLVADACARHELRGAVYVNVLDPYGVGVLAISEDEEYFAATLRAILQDDPFSHLKIRPEHALFGRTYAIGYESDLEEVLLKRPQRYVANPEWPWAVWYPLRRRGAFEELTSQERRTILMEHGGVGHAYGKADHAHDIRLACHGMDTSDNDFVVGLLGKSLYPLSAIVQRMRQTRQTSRYLSQMGPFFVGRAVWKSEYSG